MRKGKHNPVGSADCYGADIESVVRSSITEDHIASCRHWISYLLRYGRLSVEMFSHLHKVIDVVEGDIFRKNAVASPKIPPHLAQRQKRIKEHNLKIVTNS